MDYFKLDFTIEKLIIKSLNKKICCLLSHIFVTCPTVRKYFNFIAIKYDFLILIQTISNKWINKSLLNGQSIFNFQNLKWIFEFWISISIDNRLLYWRARFWNLKVFKLLKKIDTDLALALETIEKQTKRYV